MYRELSFPLFSLKIYFKLGWFLIFDYDRLSIVDGQGDTSHDGQNGRTNRT